MMLTLKVGTPLYMSPEVLGGGGYDWKSDIWSLGCLLYELAMLRSPFKSEGLSLYSLFQKISKGEFQELPAHFSEELKDLARRMIFTDANQRPGIEEVCDIAAAMKERFAVQRPEDTQPYRAVGSREEGARARARGENGAGGANAGANAGANGGANGGGDEVLYAFDQRAYDGNGNGAAALDEDDGATVPTNGHGGQTSQRRPPRAAQPAADGNGLSRHHQNRQNGGSSNRHSRMNGSGNVGAGNFGVTEDGYDAAGNRGLREHRGSFRVTFPEEGPGSATPGTADRARRQRPYPEPGGGGAGGQSPYAAGNGYAGNGSAAGGEAGANGGPAEPADARQQPSGLEFVLMQHVFDRLAVLGLDDFLRSRSHPPLGRLHFVLKGGGERLSARQQFMDFLLLVEWGVEGLGGRVSLTAAADETAPFLLATAALNACSSVARDATGAGAALAAAALAVPPVQLARGCGEAVLRVLDWLTSELMADVEPPPLVYRPVMQNGAEAGGEWGGVDIEADAAEETNGDSLEMIAEDLNVYEEEEDAAVLGSSLDEGRAAADALEASMTMLHPVVDAERWREELERVRPRLTVQAGPGDWSTRVLMLQQSEATLASLGVRPASRAGSAAGEGARGASSGHATAAGAPLPPVDTGFAEGLGGLLSSAEHGLGDQCSAIARGEKYVSGLGSLASLAAEHRAATAEAAALAQRIAELEAAVAAKAERLQDVVEEAEEAEARLAEKGESLSDTTALHRLRRAAQDLRAEIAAMDVRIALVSSQLWAGQRRTLEAKRVASAKGQRSPGGRRGSAVAADMAGLGDGFLDEL